MQIYYNRFSFISLVALFGVYSIDCGSGSIFISIKSVFSRSVERFWCAKFESYNISLDTASFSSLSSTSFIFISIYSSTTSILLNVYLYLLNFLCNQPDIQDYALCKLDCL